MFRRASPPVAKIDWEDYCESTPPSWNVVKKTGFGISRSLFQFLIPVDGLPAVLVGDGELLAAVTTAGGEHAAAVGGSHAGAEAVLVHALAVGGLKCSFHRIFLFILCCLGAVFTDGLQR